jgi:hypothetical protein
MFKFDKGLPPTLKRFAAPVYSRCPHDIRRFLHRHCLPKPHRSLQELRAVVTQVESAHSLKPFDDYKCIFIHIPKCAGISVSMSLFGNLAGGHLKARDYQLIYSKKEFDSYFKFTFVRNPWDRILSAYMYFRNGVGLYSLADPEQREGMQRILAGHPDFESFVRGWVNPINIRTWFSFLPQYAYICDRKKRPLVDFIGRVETIRDDFAIIQQRLGSGCDLRCDNRTRAAELDFRDCYTEETKAIIADVYRDDIRILGYSFDGTAGKGQPDAGGDDAAGNGTREDRT